jgi:hypothetical protein
MKRLAVFLITSVILFCAALLFFTPLGTYAVARAFSNEDDMGYRMCTDDMTPVDITLRDPQWEKLENPPEDVKLRIPKSYLVYSGHQNGGTFGFVVVSIFLDDLSSGCKGLEGKTPKPPSATRVQVKIAPGMFSANAEMMQAWVEKRLSLGKLERHRDRDDYNTYYTPTSESYRKTYGFGSFMLVPKDRSYIVRCSSLRRDIIDRPTLPPLCQTSILHRRLTLGYLFHTAWLEDFEILDSKIKTALNQFIVKE